MLDDLAGKRTGERIQILRECRGLSRPVLAGLVGMSASWLKGIERGTRLPPRLPLLVKLAEALAVGDVAVLAGTDMDLCGAASSQVKGRNKIVAFPPLGDSVLDVCFDPAGDRLAACCRDGTVTVWTVPDGAQCLSARAPGQAHAVRFSPSGRTLAVAYDHGVIAFDSATGIVAAITERD